MRLFGFLLMLFIGVVGYTIAWPAYALGRIAWAIGVGTITLLLMSWTFAIYGPMRRRYADVRSRLVAAIQAPMSLMLIGVMSGLFFYRAWSAFFSGTCALDESYSARGGIYRQLFNAACTYFGHWGYALLNFAFALPLLYCVWRLGGCPVPFRRVPSF